MKKNKKFLIFTGVGDFENQFKSWAENKSDYYDRALFYYGESSDRFDNLKSLNLEYILKNKGMIWENFVVYFELFEHYEYVLIVDSDLELNFKDVEETFLMAEKNNWTACQWSRDKNSCGGTFSKLFFQEEGGGVRVTNYIEMLFMLLRKDVVKDLVEEWKSLNLKWSEGVCFILSNLALRKKYLPFFIIDKFKFYNPHPHDKNNRREIDAVTNTTTQERQRKLEEIFNSDKKKYRINFVLQCGGKKISRITGEFL